MTVVGADLDTETVVVGATPAVQSLSGRKNETVYDEEKCRASGLIGT